MTKKALCLVGALLGVFALTACDDFYSNSWGKTREYNPSIIDLTASNLDDWLDAAVGNPDLARALTKKTKDKVSGMADDDPAKIIFQSAGVEFAFEASGLGISFAKNLGKVVDVMEAGEEDGDSEQVLINLIRGIRNDFDASVADDLAQIVKPRDGFIEGAPPRFANTYINGARASDVGIAILIMMLATLDDFSTSEELEEKLEEKITIDNQSDPWEFSIKNDVEPKIQTLTAYLNLISSGGERFDSNLIAKAIKEMIDKQGNNAP